MDVPRTRNFRRKGNETKEGKEGKKRKEEKEEGRERGEEKENFYRVGIRGGIGRLQHKFRRFVSRERQQGNIPKRNRGRVVVVGSDRLIYKYVNNAMPRVSLMQPGSSRWQLTYGRDQEDRPLTVLLIHNGVPRRESIVTF